MKTECACAWPTWSGCWPVFAKAAGKPEGRDAIYAHFVQLVRENLHIVLCMSPIGDAFRTRLRKFPSLVNCCTIDWFTAWPKDALLTVAESFLQDIQMEDAVRAALSAARDVFVDRGPDLAPGDVGALLALNATRAPWAFHVDRRGEPGQKSFCRDTPAG